MEVTASVRKDGKELQKVKMTYAGEVSHFTADLPAVKPGKYTLRILASNTKTVNFAMYERELEVR